ncbi:unnamed protein product [Camellia sinensis]
MEQMARLQTQQKQSWLQFLSLVLLVKSEREVHYHDGAHTIQAARNFLIQRYGGHSQVLMQLNHPMMVHSQEDICVNFVWFRT